MTKTTYVLFVFLIALVMGTVIYTIKQPEDLRIRECFSQGGKPLFEQKKKLTVGRSGQQIIYYSYYTCE